MVIGAKAGAGVHDVRFSPKDGTEWLSLAADTFLLRAQLSNLKVFKETLTVKLNNLHL